MNDLLTWKVLFDGWTPVLRTLVLGTLGYVALVVLLRASGKRTLSKMNAFDFVVTVAFGSTLASMLTSSNVSLVQGVTALALLIALQFVNTAIAARSRRYHALITAEPTLLFHRGEFQHAAMKRARVTESEIYHAIREQGVADPAEVDAVVMETEGSLSVLKSGAKTREDLRRVGVATV